jgi:N utilization substance protein B
VGKRHRARRTALQILYAEAYLRESPSDIAERLVESEEILLGHWTDFAKDLVERTINEAPSLDEAISAVLENWRIERLSRVDHLILRLALCELRHFSDIPLRVTLNEYIELAKDFGTDESSTFVNGILDRISKDFAEKDFDQHDGAAPNSDAPPESPSE